MNSIMTYRKNNKTQYEKTPEKWCIEMNSMLKKYAPEAKRIIDPCAGDKALDIGDYNYDLFDIEPRAEGVKQADFLTIEIDNKYDAAVVNPPFNLTRKFVDKLFTMTDKIFIIASYNSLIRYYSQYIVDMKMIKPGKFTKYTTLFMGLFYIDKNCKTPFKLYDTEKRMFKFNSFYDEGTNEEIESRVDVNKIFLRRDNYYFRKDYKQTLKEYLKKRKAKVVKGALFDSTQECQKAIDEWYNLNDEELRQYIYEEKEFYKKVKKEIGKTIKCYNFHVLATKL